MQNLAWYKESVLQELAVISCEDLNRVFGRPDTVDPLSPSSPLEQTSSTMIG